VCYHQKPGCGELRALAGATPRLRSADHPCQWDRCLSSMLIRSGLGLGFGVVFSVLLFKRRAWPAFVGLGFGAGRSWEECDNVGPPRRVSDAPAR
jgi:hypothetical protein